MTVTNPADGFRSGQIRVISRIQHKVVVAESVVFLEFHRDFRADGLGKNEKSPRDAERTEKKLYENKPLCPLRPCGEAMF